MKKEPLKTKKVTIDDLAKLIVDGRKETHDLTGVVDNLAIMVAKGFERVDKRFDEVERDITETKRSITEVKRDVAEVKENLAATRQDVLNLGDRFVPRYEFHDLLVRFDKLEQKVNRKQ